MLKKLSTLCLGLVSVLSTHFVSAYDGCYDYCGPDCGTFGIRAEYLFWKTQICDLEFAREYLASVPEIPLNPISILDNQDTTHRASYKWCSGFRLGADYQCSFDDPWRYSLVYTYFRSRDSHKVIRQQSEIEGQEFFFYPVIPFADLQLNDPLIVSFSVFDRIIQAKSHTRFRMDLGDIEIIRTTPLCGPACFNIVLGIRGGYISNRWTTEYRLRDQTTDVQNINVDIVNNWRFSNIGPRIGGQFDWCLGYGFSVYLDTSLSALWGKMRNRAFTTGRAEMLGSSQEPEEFCTVLENQHHRCYKASLMADGQIGLAFNWTCECVVVQGKLGLELVHFNSLSDHVFHRFPFGLSSGKEYRNGNIDLYGLTAGVGVLF